MSHLLPKYSIFVKGSSMMLPGVQLLRCASPRNIGSLGVCLEASWKSPDKVVKFEKLLQDANKWIQDTLNALVLCECILSSA